MRAAAVGVLVACLLFATIVAAQMPGGAQPPRTASSAAKGGLIALSAQAAEGQQVTVIDPDTRTMAVYHIGSGKGEIVLKSVRNISYDLRMTDFEGTSPLPGEIRTLLDQKY